jgi:superfamily II DNA or RNA helicase
MEANTHLYINNIYIKVDTNDISVLERLIDKFKFRPVGYKWMPAFKHGSWDGYVKLFDIRTQTIYTGLLSQIEDTLKNNSDVYTKSWDNVSDIIKYNDYSFPFDLYTYQKDAIDHILTNNRVVCLSPTGSGKSAIIYSLIRHWRKISGKTLLIVPNITLVNQMKSDFLDYSETDDTFNDEDIHLIKGSTPKEGNANLYIATWQSLLQIIKRSIEYDGYWEQFSSVLVDEAHGAAAASITKIMERLINCDRRVGLTGTLSSTDMKVSGMQLVGMFGPVYKTTTTDKLIKNNKLSKLLINGILLDYNKNITFNTYQEEIAYITNHKVRAYFVAMLAHIQKNNTIILFNQIHHGELIYDECKKITDKPIYWISGKTDGEERERIRHLIENDTNSILIGGVSVIGTGFSVKNIHNMILAHPGKSRIRTLQSIGRSLRKLDSKEQATIYDIADKFKYGKSHLKARTLHYKGENFNFNIRNVIL